MRERPTVHLVRFDDEPRAEHRATYLDEGYYSFAAGMPLRVRIGDWIAAEDVGVEPAGHRAAI